MSHSSIDNILPVPCGRKTTSTYLNYEAAGKSCMPWQYREPVAAVVAVVVVVADLGVPLSVPLSPT